MEGEHVQKLAEVLRGPIVENTHFGSIIVCDNLGNITAHSGDDFITYLRSSAKPIQLIALIESNCANEYNFTDKELAIMAGSHYGTLNHAETIASILQKLNLPIELLQCGIHDPFSRTYTEELRQQGKSPTVLNNNCSGKHAAMLALCKYNNWDLDSYLSPDHPVQHLMLKTVSEMANIKEHDVALGIDGCGVPVFGFKISEMARAFATLGSPEHLPSCRRNACAKVTSAMRAYPEMIAGEGAIDTALLSLPYANLISKIGAEAVFCLAIPNKKLGMAIKISDGNPRILAPVVIEALIQLDLLKPEEIASLEKFRKITIKNFAKKVVGEIKPVFSLHRGF